MVPLRSRLWPNKQTCTHIQTEREMGGGCGLSIRDTFPVSHKMEYYWDRMAQGARPYILLHSHILPALSLSLSLSSRPSCFRSI